MSTPRLFEKPPIVEFRPQRTHCGGCGRELKVQKTRRRTVSTLHVGRFRALEVFLECEVCGRTYRSEELCELVPPGANFGYDVMVYAGKALWGRYRNESEVVAELVPVAESVYAAVQWVKRSGLAGSGRVRLPSESSDPRALPALGSACIDIQTR